MKMVGLSVLLIVYVLIGRSLSLKVYSRKKELELIIILLKTIKLQFDYVIMPTNEILILLSSKKDFENLKFLKLCNDIFKSGKSFYDSWCISIDTFYSQLSLNKEDIELLKMFAMEFGNSDKSGQISNCDMYINLFEKQLEIAKEKTKTMPHLYNTLSALLGVLTIIILM